MSFCERCFGTGTVHGCVDDLCRWNSPAEECEYPQMCRECIGTGDACDDTEENTGQTTES